jgi:hypothetical protein
MSSSKRNSLSMVDYQSQRTSQTGGGQSLIPISEHFAHRVTLTGAQSYSMADHSLMTRSTAATGSVPDHQGQRTSTVLAGLSSSVNADSKKQLTNPASKNKTVATVRKKQSGSDKKDASRLYLPSVQRNSEGEFL